MPNTDTTLAGAQPQAESSVPAGGEQPQRQSPADFSSAIDGMDDAETIGNLLFHGKAPETADDTPPSEPSGEKSPQPGGNPQEDTKTPSAESTAGKTASTPSPGDEGKAAGATEPTPTAEDTDDAPTANAAPSLERISLKSLHPDDRKLIADAKELVRTGRASGLSDAMAQLMKTEQPGATEPAPSASTAPNPQTDGEPAGEPKAKPTPAANPVDSDPEVVRLTQTVQELRSQRQAAVEEFDRQKELELTSAIEDAVAQLGFARADASNRQRESQTQSQAVQAVVEEIYAKYPDSEDSKSYFHYRMIQEVAAYEAQRGPIRNNPAQFMVLADRVAEELANQQKPAQAQPTAAEATTPQKQPVAPPAKNARPIGEGAPGVASTGRATPDQLQRFMNDPDTDAEEIRKVLFGAS